MRYVIKCPLQVRGDDWGVSLGPGRVVEMDEDLGDGKSLEFLVSEGCVVEGQHFAQVEDEPVLTVGDVEE